MVSAFVFAQDYKIENLPNRDKHKFHFGFYLGMNQNDFKIDLNKTDFKNVRIESTPAFGFNVGLIADLRLHKNLSLRFEPGLVSNTKSLLFTNGGLDATEDIAAMNPIEDVREVNATYLHFPVLLKFNTDRLGNYRPFLLGGVSYDYNLSSNEDNQSDNFSNEFRTTSSNLMYEVGLGMDFYFPYFKFSPSIRGIFAMNNELKYDNEANGLSPWTAPVHYLGTRGVFVTLAFE